MSEGKSEFRQFIRYVTASMTDQELLAMVIRFWPRGKVNLTAAVLDTLVKKCMPYIFSPKDEAALRSHIRKIWPKRGEILDATLLKELDAKRLLFSDEDEKVLQAIYDNFPRREKSLTVSVVDIIRAATGYSSALIRDVWKRRDYTSEGWRRYVRFKNKPRLTPEESELLTKIYLNWPANEKTFSHSNQRQIADNIGVSQESVRDVWKLKQWYPNAPDISYWNNRLVAAIVANNRKLFDYYVERDDINGLVNGKQQSRGGTPLMEAIRYLRRYMFDVLMKKGVDVNRVRETFSDLKTPLVNACHVPPSQINEYVGRLLSAGADPTLCAGLSNMPPLWYYLEWVTEPTLVKRLMPNVRTLNRQTKDNRWREARESILMLACRKHPSIVPMLLSVVGLDVNQKTNYGNTALHFAAEKAVPIIELLLAVPGIEKNVENKHSKTPLDVGYCRGDMTTIEMMKDAGCRRNRANEVCRLHANGLTEMLRVIGPQVAVETTRSSSPDPSSPMMEPQNCIKFHLNQGSVGICYMVSVIALFQNEFTILHKLAECVDDEEDNRLLRKELNESDIPEVDPTIKSLVSFLSKDYSDLDFTRECPVLPVKWRKTVHQTDLMSRADIINGGSTAFLLTFIFKTLDTWHDAFNVYFDQHKISGVTSLRPNRDEVWHEAETIFENKINFFENDEEKNIALIELEFQSSIQALLKVDMWNPFEMVDKMVRKPNVRGFIVRVTNSDERGHVFAGTVCDDFLDKKVFYCNSWGKGCVDWRQINQELCDNNPTYKITTIHFVLRK